MSIKITKTYFKGIKPTVKHYKHMYLKTIALKVKIKHIIKVCIHKEPHKSSNPVAHKQPFKCLMLNYLNFCHFIFSLTPDLILTFLFEK